MVWQKKAAAPDYVNGLARMRLAVGASADDWMLPWLNLVPVSSSLDVNAFCAAGPPPPADFQPEDFIPALGGPVGIALGVIGLREKIGARAREVLFASLCENDASGAWGAWQCFDLLGPTSGQAEMFLPYPAGADLFQIKAGPAVDHMPGQGQANLYRSLAGAPTEGTRFGRIENNLTTDQVMGGIEATGAYDSLYFSIKLGYELHICARFHGGLQAYVPEEIEQPASAIAPTPGVYTTIADLGAELDAIEQKIHWVLNYVEPAALERFVPLVADEISAPIEDDEDLLLGPDVLGVIVTVSNLGNQTDEQFGEPRQLHNLGRVVLGNGTVWLPPVEITVSPMLLLKPDPTITAVRVHVHAPATAVVTTLVRAQPAG